MRTCCVTFAHLIAHLIAYLRALLRNFSLPYRTTDLLLLFSQLACWRGGRYFSFSTIIKNEITRCVIPHAICTTILENVKALFFTNEIAGYVLFAVRETATPCACARVACCHDLCWQASAMAGSAGWNGYPCRAAIRNALKRAYQGVHGFAVVRPMGASSSAVSRRFLILYSTRQFASSVEAVFAEGGHLLSLLFRQSLAALIAGANVCIALFMDCRKSNIYKVTAMESLASYIKYLFHWCFLPE